MARDDVTVLELDGHEIRFSNPGKVFFPARGDRELGLEGYPTTSAPRGIHVDVRIRPERDVTEMRRKV
jgi:DNA primase